MREKCSGFCGAGDASFLSLGASDAGLFIPFVETHQAVYLRFVHFYMLYLN